MTIVAPHRLDPPPRRPPRIRASLPSIAALLAIAGLYTTLSISAPQAPAQASTQDSDHNQSTVQPSAHPAPPLHPARRHLHPTPKPPQSPPAQNITATQALIAPPPELPHWPVNDHAVPPRIVWDSHGLRIEAANASLSVILSEISTLTGAHVDGFAADARVYGQYGPGSARDVISQLLEGTGYNVVMIGDIGQGTPRQLLLSTRTAGGASTAAHPAPANDDDADVDEQAQPQPAASPMQPPIRVPFNPNAMRNPQFPPDMQRPGPPVQQPAQPNQQ